MSRVAKLAFLFLTITLITGMSWQQDPAIPPTEQEMLGAWCGYEPGCVYFYRLVLENKNRGTCQVVFADNSVDTYTVGPWQIADGSLKIKLSPTKSPQDKISVEVVSFSSTSIDLHVADPEKSWRRSLTLYNERTLLQKLEISRRFSERSFSRRPRN